MVDLLDEPCHPNEILGHKWQYGGANLVEVGQGTPLPRGADTSGTFTVLLPVAVLKDIT